LAIAAAVVCVVLLGGIGLAAAINSTPTATSELTNPPIAQSASAVTVLARNGSVSSINAIRAFSDLGLSRAAEALDAATIADVDSTPAVQQALGKLLDIINAKLKTAETIDQQIVVISLAIADLESAVSAIRPPGLDITYASPGHGGTPPGLNEAWLEQVRSRGILSPAKEPILVPPGHEKDDRPGKGLDTAPGQTKEKPEKSGGKP
jgi:hypothetical protein